MNEGTLYEFESDPTALHDKVNGYKVRDQWKNKITDDIFYCIDNANDNAVWYSVLTGKYADQTAGPLLEQLYGQIALRRLC